MRNDLTQPRLSSGSRSYWKPKVIIRNSDLATIGEVEVECSDLEVPTLESLERRHDTSDRRWVEKWLADDVDPCQPL